MHIINYGFSYFLWRNLSHRLEHLDIYIHKFSLVLSQTALSIKAWVWQEFSAAAGFTEKGICPNVVFHLRDRSVKYKTYASETLIPISTRLYLFLKGKAMRKRKKKGLSAGNH